MAVLIVGGVGTAARFYLDKFVTARAGGSFPSGTFVVNISGAVVLGLLTGLALPPSMAFIAGTGLVGSYTTFSTWMLESERLSEERQHRLAIVNLVASVIAGVLGAALGQFVGERL